MKIEILFPEYCNLFGDLANVDYLKKTLPDAEFIETPLVGELQFINGDVDLVFMGPMTERTQERVIAKFMPHKDRIGELIGANKCFLFTGNALEVLGKKIINEDGSEIPALGIFDYYAKRDMMHRHNSNFRGFFEDTEIMGFKTQFTFCYPANEDNGFIKVAKGVGMNKRSKYEGIAKNNFFGTYLVGPILVMNPPFTKKLLARMGASEKLAFEDVSMAAYNERMKDFHDKIG